MELQEFIEEFISACDFITIPKIDPSTRFDSLEDFDSLAMLGVIVLLETKFNLTLSGDQIMGTETISGLHTLTIK